MSVSKNIHTLHFKYFRTRGKLEDFSFILSNLLLDTQYMFDSLLDLGYIKDRRVLSANNDTPHPSLLHNPLPLFFLLSLVTVK